MAKSKPTPIIIVDTREQKPFTFEGFPLITRKLEYGDYSVLGFESEISIERKELGDLLNCIFTDRFERELKALSTVPYAYLVIEASLSDIWNPKPYRYENGKPVVYQGNPSAVVGKLQSISLRYGVHVLFLSSREMAKTYTQGLLEKFYRRKIEEGKEANEINA